MANRSWLPKRLMSPLWRAKYYIELRAGMPDPEKERRQARLLQRLAIVTRRQQ